MSIYYIKPSLDLTLFPEVHRPNNLALELKPNETIKAEVVDQLPSGRIVVKIKDLYVNMRTEIPLQKDTQLLLRVMEPKNERKDLRLQLLSFQPPRLDLSFIRKIKDPKLFFFLKGVVDRGELIAAIEKDGGSLDLRSLAQHGIPIEDLDASTLKAFVQKSGLFFENKLFHLTDLMERKEKLERLHALMGELGERSALSQERLFSLIAQGRIDLFDGKEKELFDKILRLHRSVGEKSLEEIEKSIQELKKELKEDLKNTLPPSLTLHYQLLSYLVDGIYLYLPLFWEDLKDAKMVIQRRERGHLFQLDLDFEDIGRVGANAFVHEQDIKVLFFAEDRGFLEFLAQGFETLEAELQKGFRYAFIGIGNALESKDLSKEHFVEKRI